jgi:hypothetical protein
MLSLSTVNADTWWVSLDHIRLMERQLLRALITPYKKRSRVGAALANVTAATRRMAVKKRM